MYIYLALHFLFSCPAVSLAFFVAYLSVVLVYSIRVALLCINGATTVWLIWLVCFARSVSIILPALSCILCVCVFFQDTKISEIMRPRVEVVAIEANSTMMDLYTLHQVRFMKSLLFSL